MLAFLPGLPISGANAKTVAEGGEGIAQPRKPRPTLKKLGRRIIRSLKVRHALAAVARFPRNPDAPKHGLEAPLIVSLTSYPPRFPKLHLTVKSLLDQKVRPDRIVLWIAHQHLDQLPEELRALQGDRFEIRGCEDLRSFKKILPALDAFPGAFVAICDDDIYYPDTWLKRLIGAYDPAQSTIVCHRAHRLEYTSERQLAPYRSWKRDAAGPGTEKPCTNLLPTGNGGVLYPPGSLPVMTTDLELIRKLSGTCDDVWLYFMWRQAGWKIRRVPGPKRWFVEWPDTQGSALHVFHRGGLKDQHIRDMCDHFGVP